MLDKRRLPVCLLPVQTYSFIMKLQFTFVAWFLLLTLTLVRGTWRYYNTYLTYGSGDTMIQTFHAHGGTKLPGKKWNVECLDGEAMIGIADWWDDFERLEQVWCKFMFPLKAPTNGLYPYYGGCHVRNMTNQWHCYNPQKAELTVDTFVTAVWANNWFWFIFRAVLDDIVPYKCCKTPPGYYIDYVSCYYVPTHDVFFEYYDNTFNFITYCTQGYVMTGIAKKLNQYSKETQIDWIQCCRVGMGRRVSYPPPVIYSRSGAPAYYAPGPMNPPALSAAYQAQYRSDIEEKEVEDHTAGSTNKTVKQRPRRRSQMDSDVVEARPELHHLLLGAQRPPRPGTREFEEMEKALDAQDVKVRVRRTVFKTESESSLTEVDDS